MIRFLCIVLSLISSGFGFRSYSQNYLKESIEKQFIPLSGKTLVLNYSENKKSLSHGFRPWSTREYNIRGEIAVAGDVFTRHDTIFNETNIVRSSSQLAGNRLALIDYDKDNSTEVDNKLFDSHLLKTIRYYPAYLLRYIYNKEPDKLPSFENDEYVVYNTTIGHTFLEFKIRKSDLLIDKIRTYYDEVDGFGKSPGDMEDIYSYKDYTNREGVYVPATIHIEKLNRRVSDEIRITRASVENGILKEWDSADPIKKEQERTEIKTSKYSDHIYLVDIKQENTVALLVEFNDFFVSIEAPKSSENGELIIAEARKIAPDKPIRYFVAGHFHPHYLGGLRAFVHKGATVLSIKDNHEYISQQIENPHTITVDSLQLEPKALIFDSIDKDKPYVISDGEYEMRIIFIGEKSNHTYDYLVFYFPHEKMLYQGDLLFIPEDGKMKKLNQRGMSCYNVIKDHDLNVDTILQAWPVNAYGVKWRIPFTELDEIVKTVQ